MVAEKGLLLKPKNIFMQSCSNC